MGESAWYDPTLMEPLETAIREEIRASGAENVGLSFLYPSRGTELAVNSDQSFHPASTFKIAVMVEAFRRDAEGTFPPNLGIRVVNHFPSLMDGSPYHLFSQDDSDPELYEKIGENLPARELVERMIVKSSNLATNVLLELLGPREITLFMRRLGANGLVVRRGVEDNKAYSLGFNNAATARSLAIVLNLIATHKAVSAVADAAMIDILLRQNFGEGIPRFLPGRTRVAHKTGWNGLLYHDAAIVYPVGEEPYILAVMTQGLSDEKEGPDLVAKLSRLIFDARKSY